jgi:lipopolysaccharide cholinephosphotransferase
MGDTLQKLQAIQIDILKIIDQICRENNLQYSLYGGTLLGAVRHQGFIPWDDDLDVCMPRADYEKFIKLWKEINPEGYFIQNKNIESEFTQSFTKIRKDHTTFLQKNDQGKNYHTGIFVDVFPVDRMPVKKIQRMLFQWNCIKYHLYMREFVPPRENGIVRLASNVILLLTSKKHRMKKRKKFEEKLRKIDEDKTLPVVFIETVGQLKTIFPVNLLDDYVELQFGNEKYMSFAKYDEFLKIKYNDYMKFPPIEEREWKHKPLIIDFEHSYQEREK